MASPIEKPEQEETFTSEICIEPVTLRNNKFNDYNDKCVHPFCTECMTKYIQMKLEDNLSDIRCPATTCKHCLKPLSCRLKITQQLFVKWCDVLCESTVLPIERVYCPNKECSELILNECGDQKLKRCVCPTCKKPFCFMCKVTWHEGFTCEETRKHRDENSVAFDLLYKKNKWRRCPRCGHCVERVDGCALIRCRCKTLFCYKCGQEKCVLHPACETVVIGIIFIALFICGMVYILLFDHEN